jgi:hypothetical protein
MNRLPLLRLAVMFSILALSVDAARGDETNIPPPSKMFIGGNGSPDFLGFTNVYLTRRVEKTTTLRFHLFSDQDAEGEPLYFYWYDGDTIASEAAQYTNTYPHGLHTLHMRVSDNRDVLDLRVPLEVISPLDAMRRLRADLELAGVRENIAHLRPLLHGAERAVQRRHWSVAQRRLERFDSQVSVYIDNDEESGAALIERWVEAARDIIQGIQPIRRTGPGTPGGVFPGPGI